MKTFSVEVRTIRTMPNLEHIFQPVTDLALSSRPWDVKKHDNPRRGPCAGCNKFSL
jgi:hypothetical protein